MGLGQIVTKRNRERYGTLIAWAEKLKIEKAFPRAALPLEEEEATDGIGRVSCQCGGSRGGRSRVAYGPQVEPGRSPPEIRPDEGVPEKIIPIQGEVDVSSSFNRV